MVPDGTSAAGKFPVDTAKSSWEADVLDIELGRETLVGWYRNPSSGRNALAVPYVFGERHQLMHPNFLFWHEVDGGYAMDIVDPHSHALADASAKWAALAQYAQDHPDQVRRCLAVIKIDGVLRALDLTVAGIDERIAAAAGQIEIETLFVDEGMAYP